MFESAELGHTIPKAVYEKEAPQLREALLDVQMRIVEECKTAVVILVGGVDGGGKGETVNLLNEWMDPRHIQTHAMGAPSDEELSRPPMWRFWRALPPKGKLGIFFGSWYTAPIVDRVYGRTKNGELSRQLVEIVRFERMLADEGALILKFWMHLSKKDQKRKFKRLLGDKTTRWRVSDEDWEHHERYDEFRAVSEKALRETSIAEAPWTVVEATDSRYQHLTVGRVLLDAMTKRIEAGARTASVHAAPPPLPPVDERDVIADLDMKKKLDEKSYDKKHAKYAARLNALSRDPRMKDIAVAVVFEGMDASGKGGAIRRITHALDARQYAVIPTAAPTEEERAQPYLWRFWRHVPRKGKFALFDRSWYGRVLVERVEGFAPEPDWMRAYREITDFEERIGKHGVLVVKFWLAITKEVQLRRFQERERTGFKRYKITREDWRNRKKWKAYERAVCDMVDRTSTDVAPWHLVEANDKLYARIKVMRTLCERIEAAL
jgi:polyphosphate:AMP phosphotransferase